MMGTRQRCPICSAYYSASSITNHIKRHSGRRGHQCSECTAKHFDVFSLRVHVKYTHAKQRREQCPVCKMSVSEVTMYSHRKLHFKRNQFPCHRCNESYSAKSSLWNHIRTKHTNKGKVQCTVCKRHFSVLSIARHMKSHGERKRIQCRLCDSSFTENSTLWNHMKRKHKNKPKEQCPICKISVLNFRQHIRRVHKSEQKVFSCNTCQETFTNNSNLKRHMETHKPRGKRNLFLCSMCDKSLTSKVSLQSHIAGHRGQQKRVQCTVCKKYVASLRNHMDTHLDRAKRPTYSCPVCKKVIMSTKTGLRSIVVKHMAIHGSGRTLFPCEKCDTTCTDQYTLKRHITTHDKDRPKFHCTKCTKSYSFHSGLRHHMRIHLDPTEKQRFICANCNKECTTRRGLVLHLATHNTERKHFPCLICKKTFAFSTGLRAHSETHSDRHRVSCPRCGRKVLNLKTHLQTHLDHSARKTFTCAKCNFVFTNTGNVKRHMTTVHGSFACSKCKEICIGKNALRKHCSTHKERPKRSSCPKCQRQVLAYNLKKHIRIHVSDLTERQTVTCKKCRAKLTGNLQRHMADVHSSFACQVCNDIVIGKAALLAHTLTHKTKGRTKPCPKCNKQVVQLQQHLKTHWKSVKDNLLAKSVGNSL